MRKKTVIIITTILTVAILAGIITFYYGGWNGKLLKSLNETALTPSPDITPPFDTPPPDTMPPYLVLDGKLITILGSYSRISPSIQEKIDAAAFLGITVDSVAPNQIPEDELQTNFIAAGCSVYYFKDSSEEAYIIVDGEKTNYCYYAVISN